MIARWIGAGSLGAALTIMLVAAHGYAADSCSDLAGLALAECRHREAARGRAEAERERSFRPAVLGETEATLPCGVPPPQNDTGRWLGYAACMDRERAEALARAKAAAPPPKPPPPRETVCTTDVMRHGGWNRNETWTTRCR